MIDHAARLKALRATAADTRLTAEARAAYTAKADQLAAKYNIVEGHQAGCVCFDCRTKGTDVPRFDYAAWKAERAAKADAAWQADVAAEEANDKPRRSNTSHANCTHPKTKAARAACRNGRI